MTILAAIVQPAAAIVWTDSEVFDRCGDPVGHCNKLHVLARAPLVAMASGWGRLASLGEAALHGAEDVDDAAARVSAALRQNAPRVVASHPGEERDFAAQAFIVVGWSKGSNRFLGYHLTGGSFFTPILFAKLASPEPGNFASIEPRCDADVLDLAGRQIDHLRNALPAARGGDLVVAHLGERGVSIDLFRDFATSPQPEPEFSS